MRAEPVTDVARGQEVHSEQRDAGGERSRLKSVGIGPERDLPHAGAPVLDPGATWRTGVRIAVEGLT